MLSRESFLFAWNSGCLNSHACSRVSLTVYRRGGTRTHVGAIWGGTVILIVLSDLVKVIFVELSDETGKVAVLEVFREDELCEFLVLPLVSVTWGKACGCIWAVYFQDHKTLSAFSPTYDALI
jgi:hypothetical protein